MDCFAFFPASNGENEGVPQIWLLINRNSTETSGALETVLGIVNTF